MRSVAGQTCQLSGERIAVVTEGRYCVNCDAAFHIAALEGGTDFCPSCSIPFAESAERQQAAEQREIDRSVARAARKPIWFLLALSGLLCLIPLVTASFGALVRETPFEIAFLKKMHLEMRVLGKTQLVALFGGSLVCYAGAFLWGILKRPQGWARPLFVAALGALVAAFYLFTFLNAPARWWPKG